MPKQEEPKAHRVIPNGMPITIRRQGAESDNVGQIVVQSQPRLLALVILVAVHLQACLADCFDRAQPDPQISCDFDQKINCPAYQKVN